MLKESAVISGLLVVAGAAIGAGISLYVWTVKRQSQVLTYGLVTDSTELGDGRWEITVEYGGGLMAHQSVFRGPSETGQQRPMAGQTIIVRLNRPLGYIKAIGEHDRARRRKRLLRHLRNGSLIGMASGAALALLLAL